MAASLPKGLFSLHDMCRNNMCTLLVDMQKYVYIFSISTSLMVSSITACAIIEGSAQSSSGKQRVGDC